MGQCETDTAPHKLFHTSIHHPLSCCITNRALKNSKRRKKCRSAPAPAHSTPQLGTSPERTPRESA